MKKCETCALNGTGWCKGCEHSFPGVDQFDFYQEIKTENGADALPSKKKTE